MCPKCWRGTFGTNEQLQKGILLPPKGLHFSFCAFQAALFALWCGLQLYRCRLVQPTALRLRSAATQSPPSAFLCASQMPLPSSPLRIGSSGLPPCPQQEEAGGRTGHTRRFGSGVPPVEVGLRAAPGQAQPVPVPSPRDAARHSCCPSEELLAPELPPSRGAHVTAAPACVELLGQEETCGDARQGVTHGETDAGGATEEDTRGGLWKGTLLGTRSGPQALHGSTGEVPLQSTACGVCRSPAGAERTGERQAAAEGQRERHRAAHTNHPTAMQKVPCRPSPPGRHEVGPQGTQSRDERRGNQAGHSEGVVAECA
ncbi:uncharacterized protein LOC142365339 [Opisthocomus hoazin]|uniref:uncharacterized protein LOC142365339 n=1 Tax=Opisthocomus hoazin TaxID=30419 RepID=UPI003F5302FE